MPPVEVPFRFESERMLWWVDDVYTAQECRKFIERIESASPELATNDDAHVTLHTVLVYFNDSFTGGETRFMEQLESTVVPKPGRVAIFQHKLRHEGCEVTSGTKYAMRTDVVYGAALPDVVT